MGQEGQTNTHSGFEGDKLEEHLHSENPREDHVEDVHGVVKHMRLTVVLRTDSARESTNHHEELENPTFSSFSSDQE